MNHKSQLIYLITLIHSSQLPTVICVAVWCNNICDKFQVISRIISLHLEVQENLEHAGVVYHVHTTCAKHHVKPRVLTLHSAYLTNLNLDQEL